eukprot:1187874-Prorocentrum_minimum.AAC.2
MLAPAHFASCSARRWARSLCTFCQSTLDPSGWAAPSALLGFMFSGSIASLKYGEIRKKCEHQHTKVALREAERDLALRSATLAPRTSCVRLYLRYRRQPPVTDVKIIYSRVNRECSKLKRRVGTYVQNVFYVHSSVDSRLVERGSNRLHLDTSWPAARFTRLRFAAGRGSEYSYFLKDS